MRLAVTGGRGFIGSHVVSALAKAGHQVLSIDKNDEDTSIDICQTEELIQVLKDFGVETVFHLAAIADARKARADPVNTMIINVAGTDSVLEACRQAAIKRIISGSSYWIYGVGRDSLVEAGIPFLPKGTGDIYTTSKVASEFLVHDYHKLYGMPFTILRYSTPYGPGVWPGLVLRSFLDNYFSGKPLIIYGDGQSRRRFTYVEDLALSHVLALKDAAINQTYGLSGPQLVTIRELAETVRALLPDAKIEYCRQVAQGEEESHSQFQVSNDKALSKLGWEPRTGLREGVEKTIEWYRANLGKLKKAIRSK